jgi:hypothetical protein
MRFARRQIIDILRAQQIGVITLDADLYQLRHDLGKIDPFLITRRVSG